MMALVAIGMFFAGFFVLTRAAYRMAEGLQAPIRFFSGVTFPVSALPQLLQYISYVIPVTYGIMTLRTSLLNGGAIESVWQQLLALYAMTAIFLTLAYFFLKTVEHQTKKKGTLYLY
jgi:ABC-2 type transport system permease protein